MRKTKSTFIILLIAVSALLLAVLINLGISIAKGIMHPDKYGEYIQKYSAEYNIPEYVVYAVIDVESGFDPNASSGKAYGLMQITPETFKWLSSNAHLGENLPLTALFSPKTNIKYGCYYLRYLFDKFGIWNTVFAAYNAGEGTVSKWLKNKEYSEGDGKLYNIPYSETRKYVKKVNSSIEYYKLHKKK